VCGISYGAAEADQAIGQVSRSMAELSEAAAKMRNAIEDQSNVASVIEQSAVDSAAGANQIAHRIGEVAKAAGEALQFSDEVQASATGLTKAAQTLKAATDEFLSQLRAACLLFRLAASSPLPDNRARLALEGQRHRVAIAVAAAAGGDLDPPFGNRIFLDIGLLDTVEADADAVAQHLLVKVRAARVE
jgi:hypothetical protein